MPNSNMWSFYELFKKIQIFIIRYDKIKPEGTGK